jgi:hypothetical protein
MWNSYAPGPIPATLLAVLPVEKINLRVKEASIERVTKLPEIDETKVPKTP